MKLWLLRARQDLSKGDDPWDPWYDKAFGFVVRAETEEGARQVAHANAGNENRGEFLGRETSKTSEPWLDASYSSCEELLPEGEPGLVLQDFAAA